MRGQQSLFTGLFSETTAVVKKQRPRNFYLPERNEALLHRYYYHAEINRYRYDDCLKMLEQEFYLTAPRIITVLNDNVNRLSDIVHERPKLVELSKKFPHFAWRSR